MGSAETLRREQNLFHAFRSEQVSEIVVESEGGRAVFRQKLDAASTSRRAAKSQTAGRQEEGAQTAEPDALNDAEGADTQPEVVWQMIEPGVGEAEVAQIDELLRGAEFATSLRRVPPEDVERSLFGLLIPAAQVTLRGGNLSRVVRVGASVPSPKGAHYLEVSGGPSEENGVYVVSESVARSFTFSPEVFRKRLLVPLTGSELKTIVFRRGAEELALEQRAKGQFFFRDRFGAARVARDAAERLLLGFARAQLEPILPIEEVKAQLGQAPSVLELEPKVNGRGKVRVLLGGPCKDREDRVFALREQPDPIAGCVPSWGLQDFLKAPKTSVDRGLFHLRADELEVLRVESAGGRLELAREGETFRMRAPKEERLDPQVAQRRVNLLLGIRGDWLEAPPVPAPPGPPRYRVSVSSAAAHEKEVGTETIEVWALGGVGFAKRSADGAWLRLTGSALRLFSVDTLLLRERDLVKLSSDQLRSIAVSWNGSRQSISRVNGQFQLREPANFQGDGALLSEFVEEVTQLHADEWVAEKDNGGFGLQKPRLELELVDSQGNVRVFAVGSKTGEGRFFAKERANEAVFTLRESVVERLGGWLIDRSGFGFDPEQVQAVKLKSSHGNVAFRKLGDAYLQSVGTTEEEMPRLAALVEVLSLIRPERAIALNAGDVRYGLSLPSLDVEVLFTSGEKLRWFLGVADTYQGMASYYAKLATENAVYVIPRGVIDRVFEAL
jgi:hypothetical protein